MEDLLQRALGRDPSATRLLVDSLCPVVQARVARVLWRKGRTPDPQELEDLSQDVFEHLFEDGARKLRAWDGARGLSLLNFVGLLTERFVLSYLRTGKPPGGEADWQDVTENEAVNELPIDIEPAMLQRDLLTILFDRFCETASPLAQQMFQLLFVQELDMGEVVELTHMSADSVYFWRSRLRKQIAVLVKEILPDTGNLPGGISLGRI